MPCRTVSYGHKCKRDYNTLSISEKRRMSAYLSLHADLIERLGRNLEELIHIFQEKPTPSLRKTIRDYYTQTTQVF
jgi:hypothetical protein